MARKEIAWIVTRAGGFWLLLLALQLLPGLVVNNRMTTLVQVVIYLITGFYLIGRGALVIQLLDCNHRMSKAT